MSTILITGANKGLGYETARQLVGNGHNVYIGARDEKRGIAAAQELGCHFVHLDVSDDGSVQRAAEQMKRAEKFLDVLVNNAGISGGMDPPTKMTVKTMQDTFETNVFGVVRVMRAFLPLLALSAAPVIVNVSSGLGSFATVLDSNRIESKVLVPHYNASKAALNMVTLQYAKALPDFRINAVDPGYTATDLNHHSGPQTVAEGAEVIVKMASIGRDGPSGTFSDRRGVCLW